ncbi:MAG: (d)CMP kinase [Alphaproteobacteria bacterium]|nr:(d)CMP kinase [Alphaproteobacteria bacterium]
MIIAIDGTTASGKGTLARKVAERYGLKRLDTGAIYRGVALALIDAGIDPTDAVQATLAAEALDLEAIDENRIRSGPVGTAASIVSAFPAVRVALLEAQRRFAAAPQGAVLDGRDIGTVVCPTADVKLFVTADLAVRAERRWKELQARGESSTLAQVEAEIAARDKRDAEREVAPLRPALDAHLLDTTSLSIEAAAAVACRIIDAVLDP